MRARSIIQNGTIGAACDHEALANRFQPLSRLVQIISLCPLQGFDLVTEHKVHAALEHGIHVVAEKCDHAGVREADSNFCVVCFGKLLGFKRRCVTGRGGDQVPF